THTLSSRAGSHTHTYTLYLLECAHTHTHTHTQTHTLSHTHTLSPRVRFVRHFVCHALPQRREQVCVFFSIPFPYHAAFLFSSFSPILSVSCISTFRLFFSLITFCLSQ